MEKEFLILAEAVKSDKVHLSAIYHVLSSKRRSMLERRKRLKRFACLREPVKIFEQKGERIVIPLTNEELELLDPAAVTKKLSDFLQKEQVKQIFCEGPICRFLLPDTYIDGRNMKQKFLKQWIELRLQRHHIVKKELRLLIIDDNESDLISIIEPVLENLNFVTISTNRQEYFEEFSQCIMEESGLMLAFTGTGQTRTTKAQLTIDFQTERNVYRLYPEKTIVLDMTEEKEKEDYVTVKRKDIRYFCRLYESA